jgi:Zn-dependent peptidase ImmA (M78 family)
MIYKKTILNKEEIEANAFASELLMPRNFVEKEINKILKQNGDKAPDKDALVSGLAKIFQVSKRAMECRLVNLGIITII